MIRKYPIMIRLDFEQYCVDFQPKLTGATELTNSASLNVISPRSHGTRSKYTQLCKSKNIFISQNSLSCRVCRAVKILCGNLGVRDSVVNCI